MKHGGVAQVRDPQAARRSERHSPGVSGYDTFDRQRRRERGHDDGLTLSSPRARRAAGGRPRPLGELLERGHALGRALARRPLAEPTLGDAGQLGYRALGEARLRQRGDDRAEVMSGAGVQHFRTRADTLNDCPHARRGLPAIGVLSVSLGRSPLPVSRVQFITLWSRTGAGTARFTHLG